MSFYWFWLLENLWWRWLRWRWRWRWIINHKLSIINLTLGFFLLKTFKRFNESCSLSKVVGMLSTYLKQILDLLRLYSFNHLDSKKPTKKRARTGAKRKTMATTLILFLKFTVKKKWVFDVPKRKTFLSPYLGMFRFRLWRKMKFFAISKVSWSGILIK